MANRLPELRHAEVEDTYSTSYQYDLEFERVLAPNFHKYMLSFSKAYNCSLPVSIGTLLPLVACLAGPNTKLEWTQNMYSPLNLYFINVLKSGGGKSNVFKYIVEESIRAIAEDSEAEGEMMSQLIIQSYTSAGIQRHLADMNGYGILCTDEGSAFLKNLQVICISYNII